MILRGLLTLPLVSGVAATCARAPAAAPRKVRYWLGMGTGGRDIVDRTTNASCSVEVIGNLTLLHPAIDSLGIEMWELSSSGISWTSTGNVPDRGLYACIAQIHATFPSIAVGLCGSATQGGVDIAAANITTFTATLSTFIGQVAPTGSISELWTDWELESLSASQTAGANAAHAAMQALLPTYRYAGCESRDAPYLSENCSAFVAAAPGVTVQAANTYWSTAKKDVGWYKGFDTMLDQEIVNIGGAVNIAVLSPSICPDCATGADSDDSLSVKDLRARMDYVCAKGITDFSVFTFFELVERRVGGGFGIGAKYFEALAYFRTGVKGLIVSDSDTEEAEAGSSAQLQVNMKEKKVSVKGNDGPCDIYAKSGTPCVAAHSVARALFSDYTGALYEVERKSDRTALRINVLSAGGVADAAAQDKFCNGTDCMITAIFDQSELGNHLGTNKTILARTMLQHGGLGRQPWGEVSGVNASKRSVLLMGGAKVYAAVFEGKMGYRNNTAKGVASGDEGETIYMVAAGDHYNDRCCFDYGNAERSMSDDGTGSMEAVYFGNASSGSMNHGGLGNGPWVMADLEKGLWTSNVTTKTEEPITADFVFAMVKGDAGNHWGVKRGEASSTSTSGSTGGLTTIWEGTRPSGNSLPGGGHYNPMRKEGGLVLGVGGDNSFSGIGTFLEGVVTAGYSSDAADDAVFANVQNVRYSNT